jgi:phosphoglycolate phosphatase-like HAD superfamily hydrolase
MEGPYRGTARRGSCFALNLELVERGHVVWDWNGTLLDDLPIVIRAVNRSISGFGFGPIDADVYRDHYTRPVRLFYEGLFGRKVSDEEWLRLDTGFHDAYFELADDVDLTEGAHTAIDMLAEAGWSQSLLSMSPQHWLEGIVSRLGLTERLELVDGLSGVSGGLKAAHLEEHLRVLDVAGNRTVVIGDTPDDVAAARHVSARPVLFHGGSHHLEVLEAQGVPVAETLLDAVWLALNGQGAP